MWLEALEIKSGMWFFQNQKITSVSITEYVMLWNMSGCSETIDSALPVKSWCIQWFY